MANHADLTATASHVVGYVQSGDPGAIGAGKVWVDTSKGETNLVIKVRNAADTGWLSVPRSYNWVLWNTTTDGTATELFLDGAATRMSIADDTTWLFEIHIAARRTDVNGESAGYIIRGVIDRNAGTTALVNAVSAEYTNEDTAGWNATASADAVNNALIITVTGEAAKTIEWVAKVNIVEANG